MDLGLLMFFYTYVGRNNNLLCPLNTLYTYMIYVWPQYFIHSYFIDNNSLLIQTGAFWWAHYVNYIQVGYWVLVVIWYYSNLVNKNIAKKLWFIRFILQF